MITVKKFITLSCEAIDGLSKSDARITYKSIKNNENKLWSKFKDAERALSLKVELNEEIEELEEELEDDPNNEEMKKKLNDLLSSSSTVELIRGLENGFNKESGSFAQISETSAVNIEDINNELIMRKGTISTRDEDSDDDEPFTFETYMNNKKDTKIDNDNEVDFKLKEEEKDTYPVDQDANYTVIARHFKHGTTKNKNIDHSVLDLDDLQSIRLKEDSDDEYADSNMSLGKDNSKKTEESDDDSSDDNNNNNIGYPVLNKKNSKNKTTKKRPKTPIKRPKTPIKRPKTPIKRPKTPIKKPPKSFVGKKKKKPAKPGWKKKEKMFSKRINSLDETEEKEWNKLSDGALNDNNWSDIDCEELIDEASILNKSMVFVHSMWLMKCRSYCKQNKNKTKHIKFGVIIGYPLAQCCMAAKISEIKYCLKQKIDKIVLYISCGKIINRDWKYIKREVSVVHKIIGNKCEFQVKHPKSDKISAQTTALFQENVRKIINKEK